MLGGVMFGHEQMQAAINAIHDLVAEAGKPEWDWKPAAKNEALTTAVAFAAQENLQAAYQIREKQARRSEEHTSELQSLMRISYAVFCLKKKNYQNTQKQNKDTH